MKRGGVIAEGIVKKSELVLWTNPQSQNDCCAICHEAFHTGVDICRVLDCSHTFHAKCIDLWFVKASFCPLCKNDLKGGRNSSSQMSLGRSSQTSSNRSLGSASLRSGQILVGHSNSDPALLRNLQERLGPFHRSSPPATPDRHYGSAPTLGFGSAPTLGFDRIDRSYEVIEISRSARSIGLLSTSSSGVLPA
ncbi:unnamed protein product, partial [Polarella glacialis]